MSQEDPLRDSISRVNLVEHGTHERPFVTKHASAAVADLVSGDTPQQPLHLPDPEDPRLQALARIVTGDLTTPRTLADLAKQVGAGERSLTRLFQRETGMDYRQWRTQLRIQHALILLADGADVLDTSVRCGWANPSTFIDRFTAVVGQSPGHYRRALHA